MPAKPAPLWSLPAFLPALLAAGLAAALTGGHCLSAEPTAGFAAYAQAQPPRFGSGGPGAFDFQPLRTQDNSALADIDPSLVCHMTNETRAQFSAAYGFYNFTRDYLNVSYTIDRTDLDRFLADFGYSDDDIAVLQRKRRDIRKMASSYVAKHNLSQADLDDADQVIDQTYIDRVANLLRQRGFVLRNGNVAALNVPQIVKNHVAAMKPVAKAFGQIAKSMNYDSLALVGAVLSLAQTGLDYRIPPDKLGGRNTGGILVPPYAMAHAWGDCDTKTALMGAILANFGVSMVGISLPGHYLMAVQAVPQSGDIFITYAGRQYVLLEPAGPGWFPPGKVGAGTKAKLQAAGGMAVEPFS